MRLSLLALFLTAASLGAQEEADARRLVGDLGSDDYQARVDAEAALERMGEAARPYLEAAVAGADLEARDRARRILGRLELLFLRGGELERWKPELVQGLLGPGDSGKLEAGEALAVELVTARTQASDTFRGEAIRVLRWLSARTPGEGGRVVRIALIVDGDAEGILELARAFRANDGGSLKLGLMALARSRGSMHLAFAEALERCEGADRSAVESLLWRTSQWRKVTAPGRAPLLAALQRVAPEAGSSEAEETRAGLELALGEARAIQPYLSGEAGAKLVRAGGAGLPMLLDSYREPAERRALVAAAAGLAEDRLAVLCQAILPWFADDPRESFADWFVHSSPRVREVAVIAVGTHRLAEQTGAVRARLSDEAGDVRVAAAWALDRLGAGEEAVLATRRALESTSAEEVRDALWVLASSKDQELLAAAALLLEDVRPDVRAAAAHAVSARGSEEAVAGVARLLGAAAACRYYASGHSLLAEGTVDRAARAHLARRIGRELANDPEAARAEVREWLEARGR